MNALRSKYGDDYNLSIYEYFFSMYKVEEYLFAYLKSINVVSLKFKWCVPLKLLDVNMLPPLIDNKLRRKKRKYTKGVEGSFNTRRRNKCSLCKRPGHKITTCKKF